MIHVMIDMYVNERTDRESPDSQTIAEQITDELVHKGALTHCKGYFINTIVFNEKTRNRGSCNFRKVNNNDSGEASTKRDS